MTGTIEFSATVLKNDLTYFWLRWWKRVTTPCGQGSTEYQESIMKSRQAEFFQDSTGDVDLNEVWHYTEQILKYVFERSSTKFFHCSLGNEQGFHQLKIRILADDCRNL